MRWQESASVRALLASWDALTCVNVAATENQALPLMLNSADCCGGSWIGAHLLGASREPHSALPI